MSKHGRTALYMRTQRNGVRSISYTTLRVLFVFSVYCQLLSLEVPAHGSDNIREGGISRHSRKTDLSLLVCVQYVQYAISTRNPP